MKKIVFAAALMAAMITTEMVNAQPIRHRQYNQHMRIQQGMRRGELTRGEANRLRTQQAFIRHDKRMAMADGRISPRERMIINREQQRANRSIYTMKHNNRYR